MKERHIQILLFTNQQDLFKIGFKFQYAELILKMVERNFHSGII